MKNERRVFKERIKAGEDLLKERKKVFERASESVDQAMHLFGDREAARRVFPEAFDLMEKEQTRIAEINKQLEELRSKLDELKAEKAA